MVQANHLATTTSVKLKFDVSRQLVTAVVHPFIQAVMSAQLFIRLAPIVMWIRNVLQVGTDVVASMTFGISYKIYILKLSYIFYPYFIICRSSTSGNKRYENSNTYGSSNNGGSIWASSTHLSGSSGGGGGVKSYVGNGISNMHSNSTWQKSVEENNWRPMQSTQDRFDRTYNERSNSGYTAGGMFGSGGRYGGQMSRY